MSNVALNKEVSVNFYGVYEDEEYLIKAIRVPLKRNDPVASFRAAWLKFCTWSQCKMVVSRISLEIVDKENKNERETNDVC